MEFFLRAKIRDDARNDCIIALFYVRWIQASCWQRTNQDIGLSDFIILLLNVSKLVLKHNERFWKYDKEHNTVSALAKKI